MQFMVVGYDGNDENAMARRLAAREAHIKLGDEMLERGKMLYGVALLNEKNEMIGSVLICDFPSREALDEWLRVEPYVSGGVWQKIEVRSCRVGPSFSQLKVARLS